jgi:hypothetical protein
MVAFKLAQQLGCAGSGGWQGATELGWGEGAKSVQHIQAK